MPQHDGALVRALGARGADVVLADHFEQARARHARDVRALREAEHEGGPDHLLQVLPGVLPDVHDDDRRLVAEPEQQRQHDQQAEPEPRHRDEHDRDDARDGIQPAVRTDRARDARGQPHQPRDDEGEQRDLGRQRAAMEDQVPHRVAAEERLAELSGDDVVQPAHVLYGQGIGETQIRHDPHPIRRQLVLRPACGNG